MTLRHRWWMAGALLCLSAVGMQRARGQERPIALPAPAAIPGVAQPVRSQDSAHPGPSAAGAVRDPEPSSWQPPMQQLLHDAEAAYGAQRFGEAAVQFERIVLRDPLNGQAWLRLGNLHQRAGRDAGAIDAYRNAALTVPDSDSAALARGKALLNLALLEAAMAGRAIDEFDAAGVTSLQTARGATVPEVAAARHRAARAGAQFAAQAGAGASFPTPSAVPESPAAPAGFQPYTVDRWIATPRRPGTGRAGGRASVREPVTDTPLQPAPPVETIQGATRPASPAVGGSR